MRQVTERSEIDALPDGSVVHDGGGYGAYSVWIKDVDMGWGDTTWWQGGSGVPRLVSEVPLPALVICEPSDEWAQP